jgi:acyl-CoA synthetase (NDP forming)
MVAIRRAWWWRSWPARTVAAVVPAPISLSYAEPGPVLSEGASRDVVAAYGVPLVPAERASTEQEALLAAERLGYPVVMKADAPGVAHKAAAGLVRTGINSPLAARQAFAELMDRAASQREQAGSVLVEATATGIELICGMRRDPLFGPVVLVGVGGALTEVIGEVAVRVCPVSVEDVDEMLDECAVGRLMESSGLDRAPVLKALEAIARLALEHPEIEEVDVNPLFAGPAGVVAADALVVLSTAD